MTAPATRWGSRSEDCRDPLLGCDFGAPTNAEKKPIDSSTRNPLILLALKRPACGLRPLAESEGTERNGGQREKWAKNRPGGGEGGARRFPQEPAGVRGATREQPKKTPTQKSQGLRIGGGVEPCAKPQ